MGFIHDFSGAANDANDSSIRSTNNKDIDGNIIGGCTSMNIPQQKTLRDEFETNGFVCLKNIIPSHCIRQLHDAALLHAHSIFDIMRVNGHVTNTMNIGVKHGFREVVVRSPGRYEMSVHNRHWNNDTIALQVSIVPAEEEIESHPTNIIDRHAPRLSSFHQQLTNISKLSEQIHESLLQTESGKRLICLAKSLLQENNEDIYTCNMSIVMAEPGAVDQKWHADGGHLSMETHLLCHCLNVFLPLVDITKELGPTELRPGSHYLTRNLAPMMLAAKARKKLRPPCLPLLSVGDALVFDYRVLHRGRANLSTDTNRPILVITLAKKSFSDIVNFPHRSILDR